jgi:hypothetical protein
MTRPVVAVFFGGAALFLVPWAIGLARSLPCHYVSAHWGIAWAGFDTALAASLTLTSIAALRRAPWLDRAAIAAATLLAADAWFDVVTARGSLSVAIATAEAVAVELPVALLCVWVAGRLSTSPGHDHRTTRSTDPKGALQ